MIQRCPRASLVKCNSGNINHSSELLLATLPLSGLEPRQSMLKIWQKTLLTLPLSGLEPRQSKDKGVVLG